MEYSRRRDSARKGVSYRVQFSDNLIDWQDATQPEQTMASNSGFDAVAVEDSVTVKDSPRRFARVLVERAVP